jgi:anaerobic ribonucleoside-triphosphate reductase
MPNRIESAPPKNLQAAVNQMINFLWTLQNEWAW